MSKVLLPAIVGERQQLESALEKLDRARDRGGWLSYFDRQLRDIDGQLSLVKATEQACEPGLIAGYWHVKRDNPQTVPSFLVIQGPNGEFIEPHSGVLDDLRQSDLQRPGALEEIRRAQQREIADNKKRSAALREDRIEELSTRIKAIDSPGIRMGGTWSASVKGKRGKR